MNKLYAADQAEAIEKVVTITKAKNPSFIRMEKEKDGRYLIKWEGERNEQENHPYAQS